MSLNSLDAEPLIITRLKTKLGATVTVASSASIAGLLPQDVTRLLGTGGAVFLQPDAGALLSDGQSFEQIAEQGEWLAVAVVKHLPDTTTLAADYQAAGALMGLVIEALSAWNPSAAGGYLPMQYVGRETPAFSPGYAEFPLRFTVPRWFAVATP